MEESSTPSLTVPEALSKYNTSFAGLTSEETLKRQDEYGKNDVEEKKKLLFPKVLMIMWNPFTWAIVIACVSVNLVHTHSLSSTPFLVFPPTFSLLR
jgi:magnesium-transporting ATPase (P-type)